MVTRESYSKREVEACKSVLLEILHVLGEHRDSIVLVGGWVPPLLYPQAANQHVGSLDVDLAINSLVIDNETYQTIRKSLLARGYQEGKQPFIFYRRLHLSDNSIIEVEVDFLSGEYGGTGKSHRTQTVQDIHARKARGCDLAFEQFEIMEIEGELPEGGIDRVQFRVASVVPFLIMKGMAMADRLKEKDAWDIYFCLRNHPGGLDGLIEVFKPHLQLRLVREGLEKIKEKFASVNHIGPRLITNFEGISNEEERTRIQRDAFERVQYLLNGLGI
jgi:hypothetical protein